MAGKFSVRRKENGHIIQTCGGFALVLASVSAVKGSGGKQRGQNGRVHASKCEVLLPPCIATQIANVGGVTPAWRCRVPAQIIL